MTAYDDGRNVYCGCAVEGILRPQAGRCDGGHVVCQECVVDGECAVCGKDTDDTRSFRRAES